MGHVTLPLTPAVVRNFAEMQIRCPTPARRVISEPAGSEVPWQDSASSFSFQHGFVLFEETNPSDPLSLSLLSSSVQREVSLSHEQSIRDWLGPSRFLAQRARERELGTGEGEKTKRKTSGKLASALGAENSTPRYDMK
ncbi:unnamed protein product, partial [Polarella glacialis]